MQPSRDLVRLEAARELASAKINLALHVTGRRADGYHELSSLVAFAAHGDGVAVAPAAEDRFSVAGPFAQSLGSLAAADNLVMRALALARAVAGEADAGFGPLAIRLDKRLPVAAGIGGGSADAAALLRLLAKAHPAVASRLREASLRLGADVPMCFDGAPARVEGIGEIGRALPAFPAVPCLLVNPGTPVSTPEVFRRLTRARHPALPAAAAAGFPSLPALLDYLAHTRNDLEPAALSLAPAIGAARAALAGGGALLARMSGSGATVFGLFRTAEDSDAAAARIAAAQPGWWIMPTMLRPANGREP